MATQYERKPLIIPISELSRVQDDHMLQQEYASSDDAFLNQSIINYSLDEVHAMMQIMCCNIRLIATCYNPLYLIMFVALFIVVVPGATLHWALLCCISVRKRESPEERELRSQGIYAALGLAMISMFFGAIGMERGTDEMVLVNKVSLYVNASIIVSSLIGLKAAGDELKYTIRMFVVGAWIIDIFLICLCLVDVYNYITFAWISTVSYSLRLFGIVIYSIVALQCMSLWDAYTIRKQAFYVDIIYTSILGLIYLGVIVGFMVVILTSEKNAWKILYF